MAQKWTPQTKLAHAVYKAGFEYDPVQDIIYSRMFAHQHLLGYCWAYDESSAHVEMIIDCEPFYFLHQGEAWMIELWKGQYGLETGCEIGVYHDGPFLGPLRREPFNFRSRFFRCVEQNNEQMLHMRSALYRNGKLLFERAPQHHWWLTGFKWGVFTENTVDLVMRVQIDFPSVEMCLSFKTSAWLKGYMLTEMGKKSVAFTFQYPRSQQPASRKSLEPTMQMRSKVVVEGYNQLKKEMHIAGNDPNSFEFSQYEAPAAQLTSSAAAKASQLAASEAKAVQHQAAHVLGAVHRQAAQVASIAHHQAAHVAATVDHEAKHIAGIFQSAASDEATAAYKKIFAFFDEKMWRTTSHPPSIA